MPDTSHDPFQALAREARNTEIRYLLGELAGYLNDRYGIDLATVQSDRSGTSQTPFLYVGRAQTTDAIAIAVSVDQTAVAPYFLIEAYTSQAWAEYGDPFVTHTEHDPLAAGRLIWLFVPPQPTY